MEQGAPKVDFHGWFREIAPLALALSFGVLIAALPHFINLVRIGEPTWISDYDDLYYYLAIGEQAYEHHPFDLADPVLPADGVSMYPRLQLTPGVLIARAAHWGPMGINFAWRILSGLGVSLGFYLVARWSTRSPWWSAAIAIWLCADVGVVSGWPLIKHLAVFFDLARHAQSQLLASAPIIHPLWRLVSPALPLPWLLLMIGLWMRAVAHPVRGRIVTAGIGFGILFYDYFFFWTAAGLALLLCTLWDRGSRRVHFLTGAIGFVVGLPAVYTSFRVKTSNPSDWGARCDYFLSIGRFQEIEWPLKYLIAATITGLWVWFKRRDLVPIWSLAIAGLVLRNEQILTGLQIQNWHWDYAIGAALSLVVVLSITAAAGRIEKRRGLVVAAFTACLLFVAATGVWMRYVEATRTKFSRDLLADYLRYREQRHAPGSVPLEPNAVVAGDRFFLDWAAVLDDLRPLDRHSISTSIQISDSEWDERSALNAYLRGLDSRAFESEQKTSLKSVNPRVWGIGRFGDWTRDERIFNRRIAGKLAAFESVRQNPQSFVKKYHVRYLVLPADQQPPSYLSESRREIERSSAWRIWELEADRSAPSPREPARSIPTPSPSTYQQINRSHESIVSREKKASP